MPSISPYRRKIAVKRRLPSYVWPTYYISAICATSLVLYYGASSLLALFYAAMCLTVTLSYGAVAIFAINAERDALGVDTSLSSEWLRPIVLGSLLCALMYGALETGTQFGPTTPERENINALFGKGFAVYLSSIGFAATFTAFQAAFRGGPKLSYEETSHRLRVTALEWVVEWQRTLCKITAANEASEPFVLYVDLSTTEPILQNDIELALQLRTGHILDVVEVANRLFVRSISSDSDIGTHP